MADWTYAELDHNPALHHYVYLPATLLLPLPVQAVMERLWGWSDQRIVALVAFVMTLILAMQVCSGRHRLGVLIALGLNPLFVASLVEGHNEWQLLLFVVWTVLLLSRGHIAWATVTLAVACATKQSAWTLVPFFLLYVFEKTGWIARRDWRAALSSFLPGVVVGLGITLPLFIWSPRCFLEDIFVYPNGGLPGGYAIRGFSLSSVLLVAGLIPSNLAPYPATLLQLLFGIPAMLLLLRFQARHNNLSTMLLSHTLLLFVLSLFARAFNNNYLAYMSAVLSLAYFVGGRDILTA